MDIREIKVGEDFGQRLDLFLANMFDDLSRSKIQQLIKKGKVLVNGRVEKPSYPVEEKDLLSIEIPEKKELVLRAEDLNLDVIYEDDHLAIINKPVGMVVHPAPGHESGTLVNGLLYQIDSLSSVNDSLRPGIVHRLDKDTSGLIIVAKDNKSHEKLARQFKNREVDRIYRALVFGNLGEEEGLIDAPIGRHPVNRQKMAVVMENSREALTEYRLLERFDNYSLLELSLRTGRTHQIRVHLNYINYPIVGDPIYSSGKNEFGLDRQFLHAVGLGFKHPANDEYVFFELDQLPEESERILGSLRRRRDF